jgi:hypothetical protein
MSRNASGKNFTVRTELARLLAGVSIEWDADEEDDDKDKGASGSGDGNGSEGSEGESGASGSDSGDDDATIKDPDKKRLADEAAKHRLTAKEQKSRADAAEKLLRELEDKDKSELEKAQRDLAEVQATVEKLQATVSTQAVKLAFFESGAASLFKNPAKALRLLDLDDLKPNEEGEMDAKEVKARADALLKSDGYLAADGSNDGGDDKPGGSPNNGRKNRGKDAEATRQKLAAKFPALASRG